jgi:hypothetical protein
MALLTFAELQLIKPISANNAGKFDDLLKTTLIKDIKPLLGFDFYQDMIQNESTVANARLLAGDTYIYSGITYTFEGLKTIIAYFLYANYVMSNLADTFTGFVTKSNEDSQPASSGDKKNLRDINIETAMQHWEDCKYFLDTNAVDYPYYLPKTQNNRVILL